MKDYEEMASEVLQQRDDYEAKRTQRRKTLHRRLTTTLTALAIILTVGAVGVVGVAAGYLGAAEYFKQLFEDRIDADLSEEQQQIVSENVLEVNQSVTHDDVMMTVEYVLRSRNHLLVHLVVEYPDRLDVTKCQFGDVELRSENGRLLATTYHLCNLDFYRKKNVQYYTIMMAATNSPYTTFAEPYIISDETVTLTFSEIHQNEEGSLEFEVVSDGNWQYELTFDTWEDRYLELVAEPVTGEILNDRMVDLLGERSVVEVTSLRLYELSGIGTYQTLEGKDMVLRIAVVMKDGTMVESNHLVADDRSVSFSLESVIALENVDYVLFGGYKDGNGDWAGAIRFDIPNS